MNDCFIEQLILRTKWAVIWKKTGFNDMDFAILMQLISTSSHVPGKLGVLEQKRKMAMEWQRVSCRPVRGGGLHHAGVWCPCWALSVAFCSLQSPAALNHFSRLWKHLGDSRVLYPFLLCSGELVTFGGLLYLIPLSSTGFHLRKHCRATGAAHWAIFAVRAEVRHRGQDVAWCADALYWRA